MEENIIPLDFLRPEEQRILGSLIEKSITTPDYYPLTLNSLTTACNQKSARNPVVNYDKQEVILALDSLQKKGYTTTESGAYSRNEKYEHRFHRKFELSQAQLAIMCLLFLRGPQTAGELKSHAGRLYSFESLNEVHEKLNDLQSLENPLVHALPKAPGQKEGRWLHCFQDLELVELEAINSPESVEPRKPISELEERLSQLENQVSALTEKVENLLKELS